MAGQMDPHQQARIAVDNSSTYNRATFAAASGAAFATLHLPPLAVAL
jgi:hypothetical protein